MTAFTIPATATTLTVPITTFTASDNVGVTGYLVTETSTTPAPTAGGWSTTTPASYTFTTAGAKTLYAWAKDAAGNVSTSRSATVTITLPSAGPEPAGWYAGDMHVHRSCGGSPISVSAVQDNMDAEDLAVVSLLADMGNGEVQDPVTDLPLVNGQDDLRVDTRSDRALGCRVALGCDLYPVPEPGPGWACGGSGTVVCGADLGGIHLSDFRVGASAGRHRRVRAHAVPR